MQGVSRDTNTRLPDSSKTLFLETTDFSSQKLFPFDLLQADT